MKAKLKKRQEETAKRLIQRVSWVTNISIEKMKSKSKKREIVRARYLAIGLIRTSTMLNQVEVGELFNRDHSTISSAETYYNNPPITDKAFIKLKNAFKGI